MSILAIGTVALDTVTTPFGVLENGLGGSATHFAASASYFNDVHLVAVIGADFPKEHLTFLKSRNIDIEGLETLPGKTFHWTGKYDYDLNNAQTLQTDLNVLLEFKPKLSATHKKIEYVFLANIDPDLQSEVIDQVHNPKVLACDTMNFWITGKPDSLKKTLSRIKVLTINEGEARLLSGESNLLKAIKKIQTLGPKILVVKRGEYGALLMHGDKLFSAPGLPIEEVKDPTGAGDSFAGGLMGYLAKSGDLTLEGFKQAVIHGSVMASFNVEAFSCERLKNLKESEIRDRYQLFKQLSHFDAISL